MTIDRPDEENEGSDAFTVDERELIDESGPDDPDELSLEGVDLTPLD